MKRDLNYLAIVLFGIISIAIVGCAASDNSSDDEQQLPENLSTDRYIIETSKAGEIAYSWIDPSDGTISLNLTDNGSFEVAMGIGFQFFENQYSSVHVNANGFISFQVPPVTGEKPQDLEDAAGRFSIIAGLWMDLDPYSGGTIFYGRDVSGDEYRFVVTYNNVLIKGTAETATLQIVLNVKTNAIEINIKEAPPGFLSTQGIVSQDGTEISYSGDRNLSSSAYVEDSIRFTPIPLLISSTAYNIAPSDDPNHTYSETVHNTPTEITLGNAAVSSPIDIGFDFQFFSQAYSRVFITSDGYLSFEPITQSIGTPQFLPSQIVEGPMIAPFWTDLNPAEGGDAGDIRWERFGTSPTREFWVTYRNVYNNNTGNRSTFQVGLYEGSGDIVFNYINADASMDTVTIGIQKSSTDPACFWVDYNHKNISLPDNYSLKFSPVVP